MNKSYENYENIKREYQSFIIINKSTYIEYEKIINNKKMPINYFLNKSYENIL